MGSEATRGKSASFFIRDTTGAKTVGVSQKKEMKEPGKKRCLSGE